MGRWRSGAPLALCPLHDDPELGADPSRNNGFMFQESDPVGYVTPRRVPLPANESTDTPVAGVVRIHRMIRRGTAYGPLLPEGVLEDDGLDRGLMFAFVGSYLKRQFEFVQSEWINDGVFLGVEGKDPVAGAIGGDGTFSFPNRPIPRKLRGLSRFVVTRGGEYCFMPSLTALRWLAGAGEPSMSTDAFDMVVIGAGPAGLFAALRAGMLGARTALVSSAGMGGMAAEDGPVPVRTLAHAARLVREARQLGQYGITGCEPVLDYRQLLRRVNEVVGDVGRQSVLRTQLDDAGVAILEHAGLAGFQDAHTIALSNGRRLTAEHVVICTGGVSRRVPIPGFEHTVTHSDAWGLQAVPDSMLVIGGGATGMQVASVFNAFGARVDLFETNDRILKTEDEDVAAAVAEGYRTRGIIIHTSFGSIDRFESVPGGVAMHYSKDGKSHIAQAALAVAAMGWVAQTDALNLAAAGIATNERGFVKVDDCLRTSAPNIYAAGDVTGRMMLAPQAIHQGFLAATNALSATQTPLPSDQVAPMGSFTDPEYAQVGFTEARARESHSIETVKVPFDAATRPIIDGRSDGFCKLIADRDSGKILGCHVVGERAVDIVQVAAIAMAAGMTAAELARIPLAFPTYGATVARAAAALTSRLQRVAGQPSAEMLSPVV